MSIDDNKSYIASLLNSENKDTIPNRIQFVKTLLQGNELQPLINFDNTDTENFMGTSKDDDSGESYDTRIALQKKVFSITDIISNIGGTLKYIKSGTTGHTFKGVYANDEKTISYEYAVKVVAYGIKDKYGGIYDVRRPENAELLMIKVLSYFIVKKKTPHIILPIGTFDTDISHFTNLIEDGYIDSSNERYCEFVEKYKRGEYYDKVSVLISEWANKGDFLDFIRNNYRRFMPIHWKVFFFQLISTLAVIQSTFPAFRHNDLKANNILVTKINKIKNKHKYRVTGNLYKVPNIGYQLKLWDFDFACIPGVVDNKKVMISNRWSRGINISSNQNRYYDIHYFFNTLIRKGFFPELLTDSIIPQEVKNFVLSIVPQEYQTGNNVADRGRILIDVEYAIPNNILRTNPYFDEFRSTNVCQKYNDIATNEIHASELKIDDFLRGGIIEFDKLSIGNKKNKRQKNTKKTKTKTKTKSKSKKNIKTYTKNAYTKNAQ